MLCLKDFPALIAKTVTACFSIGCNQSTNTCLASQYPYWWTIVQVNTHMEDLLLCKILKKYLPFGRLAIYTYLISICYWLCWDIHEIFTKKRSFSVVAKDRTNGVEELLCANWKKRPALKSENWSQQMKFWWLFLCALLQRRVIARRRRDRQTAGNLRVHTFQFQNCQFTKCTQTKCKKTKTSESRWFVEKSDRVLTLSWVVCIIKCRMKLGSEDK